MTRTVLLALLLVPSPAHADATLCQPDEAVVLTCHLGEKTLSLCRPRAASHALRFRLGRSGHVAREYPTPGSSAPGAFVRSERPLIGGGETSVSFTADGAAYTVFSRVARSERDAGGAGVPEFEDGLTITRDGESLTKICGDGGEGFRESVAWVAASAAETNDE